MSNCTSGCPTQDCNSYAECLRNKGARVAYADSANGRDYTAQKKWDAELASYREAKAEGLQPAGTRQHQIDRAKAISDRTGVAYKA